MKHEVFDEQTESQLKVLREIGAISDSLDIEFWLRG